MLFIDGETMGGKSKSSSSQTTKTTTNVHSVNSSIGENDGLIVTGEKIENLTLTDHDAVEAAKQITLAAIGASNEAGLAVYSDAMEFAQQNVVPITAKQSENLLKYTTFALLGLGAIFMYKGAKK